MTKEDDLDLTIAWYSLQASSFGSRGGEGDLYYPIHPYKPTSFQGLFPPNFNGKRPVNEVAHKQTS